MNLNRKVSILLMLSLCYALSDTASVTVTISSQNIQNGSLLMLTATFDPAVDANTFKDLICKYSDPAGGATTDLTTYNSFKKQIVTESSLSPYNKARVNITSPGNPMVLVISPITFDDEKRLFSCTLEYYDAVGNLQLPITSEQHRLENVYSPMRLNEADSMQNSTSVTEGIAANLTCIATGRPAPTITWQYNVGINATISNTSVGSPLITVTGILSIHNPTQTMDGLQVTCFIRHQFTPLINRTTTLSVFYRPINTTLIIYPQDPKLNEDITLSCSAIGKPNVITYRFFINQTYIGNSTNGNLTINANTCSRYNSYYRCIPVNVRGEGEEKQQLIGLRGFSFKDDVRTSTASASLAFNETQSATLFCTVSGCPEPSVSWSRNGVSLHKYGNSLLLPLLNRSHAGRYSCNASNGYTSSSSQIEVTINYKPIGTQLSASNTKPLVNSSVVFSCTADAVPVAKYRFVRVGGSGEREVSSSNSEITGILMVSRIMHAPNAYNVTYKCIPYNMLGNGLEQIVMLDIQDEPYQVQLTASPPKPISGSSVTLNCMARGSPSPSFRFVLVNGSSTETVQDGSSAIYTISKLDYKEYSNYTAIYRCIAYSSFGNSPAQTLTFHIQVRPVLRFFITPSIVIETQNATADCKVLAANPAPNITIKGNNNQIIPHIGGQTKLDLITRAQAGEYSCIADNGVVGATISTATLNVNYAPDRVDLSSSSMTPLNGSSVTFNCSSSGSPPPHRFVFSRISGSSQTEVQDSSSSVYLIGMINFKNFINYKAMFACVPYNTAGKGPSKNVTLDIQVRPEISVTSPVTALEGDNVNFRCTVTAANPTASVMWRGPSNIVLSSSPLLTLNSVNRNQGGEYTCIASNGISPNARKTTYLSVNYGPQFTHNSTEYEGCLGESASIICSAVGRPMPDVSLYFNGNVLQRNMMNLTHQLQLDSANKFATYTCVGNSTVGTANITITFKRKSSCPTPTASTKPTTMEVTTKPTTTEVTNGGTDVALIGGITGGICFFIIIVIVCILVAKKRRNSSEAEESIGSTNKGFASEKDQSTNLEMGDFDTTHHYKAPDGSVYASVKGKSEDANGAIDNKNFVADSDGAYEPVNDEAKKKKEEGNYAELGAFVTPNNNDKPKEKPKTEYATLEELGPLKDYDETEKQKEEEPATHKITVEPESNEAIAYAPAAEPPSSAPAADPPSSAPAADSSGNGGISVNVDMI